MSVSRIAGLVVATGVIALGGAATAQAATSSVVVQPGSATAGSQVSVFGTACTASTGTATSRAFSAPISLSMLSNSTGGVGKISSSAMPGTYVVTVNCGTQTFTGSVTVVPKGGAMTGDGASLIGSGAGETTGLAMVGGAVGLGALAMRRRAAHR